MHILVVDDNPSMNRFLTAYLHEAGYRVSALTEGMKAPAWLNLHPCDAVVLDIGMPDCDGIDLISKIREEHPHLPVVMFTGLGYDEATMQAARKAGASGYVSKGAGAKEIQLALMRAVRPAFATR